MKKAVYYLLDVFTKDKYQGNPLAIFPDSRWIPPSLMQTIAEELNLSETVFLYRAQHDGSFPMRIFTPKVELPIAGHPTIGTGYYLARELDHPTDGALGITLEQKVGHVPVEVTFQDNLPKATTMRFPKPKFGDVIEAREALSKVIGLSADDLMDLPIQAVSCGVPFLLLPIKSLEAMKEIRINLEEWRKTRAIHNSLFIYAFTPYGETPDAHVHGRMFAPGAGIFEDPATGAANAPLAAYLHHYGLHSGPILSEQGFEMGRKSFLHLNVILEKDMIQGVELGGDCVFVGSGELFLD